MIFLYQTAHIKIIYWLQLAFLCSDAFIDFSLHCPLLQYQSDWISIFSLWDYMRNLRCLTVACIRSPNIQRSRKMNEKYIIFKVKDERHSDKNAFFFFFLLKHPEICEEKWEDLFKGDFSSELKYAQDTWMSIGFLLVCASLMRCDSVTFFFSFVSLIWLRNITGSILFYIWALTHENRGEGCTSMSLHTPRQGVISPRTAGMNFWTPEAACLGKVTFT